MQKASEVVTNERFTRAEWPLTQGRGAGGRQGGLLGREGRFEGGGVFPGNNKACTNPGMGVEVAGSWPPMAQMARMREQGGSGTAELSKGNGGSWLKN